jgi:OOP family OmpA-OmpF porin
MLYHFIPENTFVPYLAVGLSGVNFDAAGIDKKARVAVDYGLGAKYFVNDSFALRADVRHIIYNDNSQTKNNLEYTIGAYIPFGGVTPATKPLEPPPTPAPVSVPKAVEPPPAPAAVVVPSAPALPTAKLTVMPTKVAKGQTATLNWESQNAAACNIQPGIGPVPPQGVRTITPVANTSYIMECSGTGGRITSAAGVTVVVPAPVTAKPKSVAAAERFCSKPAVLNIQFETNSSDIKPQYTSELTTVVEFLREFPKARGEISGHTDNVAGQAYNGKLSQARADSVKKYLVEKYGISPDRISAKGYGYSKPVSSNKTKEGKAKNRRIEVNFKCE